MRESTWETLREEGCVIEEETDSEVEGYEGQGVKSDEEKAAHAQAGEFIEKLAERDGTPSPPVEGDEKGALGLILDWGEEGEPREP